MSQIVFKKESNGMQRWNIVALARGGGGGEHMTGAEICVSPVFSSLAKRKYPPYHLTQLLTQLGLRQESDNLKGGILWRSQGGIHYIHITEPVQRYLYPLSIF